MDPGMQLTLLESAVTPLALRVGRAEARDAKARVAKVAIEAKERIVKRM